MCLSNCPSSCLNFPVSFQVIHLHPSFSRHHSSYCQFPLPQHWLSVNTVCSWEGVNTHHSSQTISTDWLLTRVRFSCSTAIHEPSLFFQWRLNELFTSPEDLVLDPDLLDCVESLQFTEIWTHFNFHISVSHRLTAFLCVCWGQGMC